MSDEYAPTTEDVRSGYARDDAVRVETSRRLRAQFNRWLAAHDAEVARQQAEHDAGIADGVERKLLHASDPIRSGGAAQTSHAIRAQFEKEGSHA